MIDTDFIIFSYLLTREILKIFEFYFPKNLKNKKTLNLHLGNKDHIQEIEEKYPVIVKCKYVIDPIEIDWYWLSSNPKAVHILKQNLNKLDWEALSRNPKAIKILEQNLEKIDWYWLSYNPKAIHILEQNLDKVDWDFLSMNPNAPINLLQKNLNKLDRDDWSELSGIPEAIKILENNKKCKGDTFIRTKYREN